MVKTFPVPEIAESEIREFAQKVMEFQAGLMEPVEFRRYRLTHGIYGQRHPGVNMVRAKIPYGGVDANQLRRLAEIADDFSTGMAHVTTRQDIQFHFVPLERVPSAMRLINQVGLTTRQACGNSVRNVTGCSRAGLCRREAFDISPYAQAVFEHFLRNPIVVALPRKFKIAFSGCEHDCSLGGINDIGLAAVTRGDNGTVRKGFRMVVGGGLGPSPQAAVLLSEFVPVDELIPVCEAVVRVFNATGNRSNRNKARMKFVIRKLGREKFCEEVWKVRATLPERVPIDETASTSEDPPSRAPAVFAEPDAIPTGFGAWRKTNLSPQKQEGYYMALVTLPHGDVSSKQMRKLADMAEKYGNGRLCTDVTQNFLFRWVSGSDVLPFYTDLQAVGLAEPGARSISDIIACPGADTCSLGITHPRGLAVALRNLLSNGAARGIDGLEGSCVKISGCPNACAQHHIATIGFHGAVKDLSDQPVPAYQLLLGGCVNEEGVRFSRPIARIPARRIPAAVKAILDLYQRNKTEGGTFVQYAARVSPATVRTELNPILEAPIDPADAEFFVDWGQKEPFFVMTGEGECAA